MAHPQAAAWHRADIVLGPWGADETNGVFSRPGSVHIAMHCHGDSKKQVNWGNVANWFGTRARLLVRCERKSRRTARLLGFEQL